MVDERGRATGEAEGAGRGALFGLDGTLAPDSADDGESIAG